MRRVVEIERRLCEPNDPPAALSAPRPREDLCIAGRVRTGISIFSYDGTITFGLTGDFAANPDLDVLASGIEHGVAELLAAGKAAS